MGLAEVDPAEVDSAEGNPAEGNPAEVDSAEADSMRRLSAVWVRSNANGRIRSKSRIRSRL